MPNQDDDLMVLSARESLATYLSLVHRTDDGEPAIPPRHLLDYVIPALEDDSLGHTLIVAPPGSIKTNTMIGACEWWLGRDPTQHLAYVCSTGPKANERSLVVRDVIEQSALYQTIFPGVVPDKTRGWAQDAWFLRRPNLSDKNPSMLAVGVGGAILGARVHRAVLDDIADEENMRTELQRKQLVTWLQNTFLTRLDDPVRKRAILIMTRWHEDDPAAWAKDQGWHVIEIPAQSDEYTSYWPERWPEKRLACPGDEHAEPKCFGNENCMKRQLGPQGYAQQYLCVVTNEETALFRRNDWRRYRVLPETAKRGVIVVDLAHSEKTSADFTVVAVIAADGPKMYWRHLVRRRMQFPEVERVVSEIRAQYPGYPILIEDVSNSKPLIQQLRRTLGSIIGWPLEGRSKLARMTAASPACESGDFFLPQDAAGRDAGWVAQFIDEHSVAPNGKYDDQCDTTALAFAYFAKRGPRPDLSKTMRPWTRAWERVSA